MPWYRSPGVYIEETDRVHAYDPSTESIQRRRSRPRHRSTPAPSTETGVASASVSLALTLLDARTGTVVTDRASDVRIDFPGLDAVPTPHQSGYYLFTDLPVDAVTVAVAGGDRYHDEERTVQLADPPVVIAVRLFARGETFVRGTVRDTDGTPLSGVELAVPDLGASVESDRNGEFALVIRDAESHVDPPGGTRVQVDGTDPEIDLRYDSYADGSAAIEVEIGVVTAYELVYGVDGTVTVTPLD